MKTLSQIHKFYMTEKRKKMNKIEKYVECEYSEHTHVEITIGSHVEIYPKFIAQQYAGVLANNRRYLKEANTCMKCGKNKCYKPNSYICSECSEVIY